jgi:HSP20 family protein
MSVMTLVRWNPYRGLRSLNRELEGFFEDWGTPWLATQENKELSNWTPEVDLSETKEGFMLKAELPGVKKEDVKITLKDDLLTIAGEKKSEKEIKDENYHRTERVYGSFARSFRLPTAVEVEKVKAEYKDGVLHLTLPKAESVKPKEIQIS